MPPVASSYKQKTNLPFIPFTRDAPLNCKHVWRAPISNAALQFDGEILDLPQLILSILS